MFITAKTTLLSNVIKQNDSPNISFCHGLKIGLVYLVPVDSLKLEFVFINFDRKPHRMSKSSDTHWKYVITSDDRSLPRFVLLS